MDERVGRWAHLTTVGEAVEYCLALFDRQVERAELENTPPNEPTTGDASARMSFLSLLPLSEQRAVFLSLTRRAAVWPRIRTLVGAPPYSFLRPEDDQILRAAGLAKGRVHMARQGGSNLATGSNDFGVPQFTDESERSFKFLAASNTGVQSTLLPFVNLTPGRTVMADIRLKRRKMIEKMQIQRSGSQASKASLKFPGPGARVSITPTPSFQGSVSDTVTLRVASIGLRPGNLSVARIVGVIL